MSGICNAIRPTRRFRSGRALGCRRDASRLRQAWFSHRHASSGNLSCAASPIERTRGRLSRSTHPTPRTPWIPKPSPTDWSPSAAKAATTMPSANAAPTIGQHRTRRLPPRPRRGHGRDSRQGRAVGRDGQEDAGHGSLRPRRGRPLLLSPEANDVTFTGMKSATIEEVTVYEERDGKVIREQFFYTPQGAWGLPVRLPQRTPTESADGRRSL